MILPILPPDLEFPRLSCSPADMDFSFEAKRAAMRPYIAGKWGWDETFQRNLHDRLFGEKPFFEIRNAQDRLGTVSFQVFADHVRFGEFYLFPAFQGRGTGTRVLQHCLWLADGLCLPVRLEHLLWNPVGSLYRRNGFVETGQSDTHCFLERPCQN